MNLRRRWPLLLGVAGLLLVLIAALAIGRPHARPGKAPVHPTAVLPAPSPLISPEPSPSTSPSAEPSPTETPVDGMRIQVPELGIDLPVVPGDGVNAPLYKAVLDPFLAQPGSGHRSMIYAHAQNGMFGPLFNTRVGQHVVIRRPNQPDLRYVITDYFAHWPINDLSPLQPVDQEQVVLVTCTTYNLNDPRQVVFTRPA